MRVICSCCATTVDATATVHTVHCCRTLAHTDTLLCTTLLLLLLLLLLSAGQEKFHVITRAYYRGAHGIALIYDVTDADSFKNVNYWMANIQTHASAEPIHKVLLGNKVDLPSAREIPTDSGREVGEEFGVQFFEVSAKDGTGVNDAFHALVTEIVARLECEAAGAGEDSAANSGSAGAAGSSGKWLSRKAVAGKAGAAAAAGGSGSGSAAGGLHRSGSASKAQEKCCIS
jgi:small GTP-binding protein